MVSSTTHDLLVIASLQPHGFTLSLLQQISQYTTSKIEEFVKTAVASTSIDQFVRGANDSYQFSSAVVQQLWADRIGDLYDKGLYKKIISFQQSQLSKLLTKEKEDYWVSNIGAFLQLTKDSSISAGNLEIALQSITEILSKAVKVARASIWRYDHEATTITCLDLYEHLYQRHTKGVQLSALDFPQYFEAIRSKEYIKANDAITNPATCEFTEIYLKPLGIGAMLDVPFYIDGVFGGVICFEHVGGQREWQPEDILFTVSMSAMVSLAYASIKSKEAEHIAVQAHNEVVVLNEELYQQQEEITTQRDLISERNRLLELSQIQINSSIRAAQLIQKAVMPTKQVCEDLLGDCFIFLHPKDIVSGDFYWLHRQGQQTFVVVADCTGHGVAGAFMSLLGYSLLNYLVKEKQIVSPHQILERLHQEIQLLLRQHETRNMDGMDLSIVVIDKESMTNAWILAFAGAKRPLFYITAESDVLVEVAGERKSIGGKQAEHKQFKTQQVILPYQSIFYLFTDGYVDQNNAIRERIGMMKFKELLMANHHKPMATQKQYLVEYLQQHAQNTTQRDDILLLAVRVGVAPTV